MTPLSWRDRARAALTEAGERCFVRFARAGDEALFITDARDVSALVKAGFCVRAQRGRIWAFDAPDAWYLALSGCTMEKKEWDTARGMMLSALSHRLSGAAGGEAPLTDAGRAFLREVARGCFAPGGADAKTIAALRSRAAVLQRGHDTGAFAAAAGLAAAALYQEGLR